MEIILAFLLAWLCGFLIGSAIKNSKTEEE